MGGPGEQEADKPKGPEDEENDEETGVECRKHQCQDRKGGARFRVDPVRQRGVPTRFMGGERSARQMPMTATAMEAAMSPYPRRRLNHGPKVASANDTMPRARSPAFVDRNAVAFNVGPSERGVRTPFVSGSGMSPHHRPPR